MINKIKENKYIKIIRELWQNTRTRAAVILGLWIIFFVFVFAVFDIRGNHTSSTSYNAIETWKESKNYEYDMEITVNQDTYLIRGMRNSNLETFSFQEMSYYLENEFLFVFQNVQKIFQENTILLGIDFLKLRPEFLNKVLQYGKLEYTTKYESGEIRKGYQISTAKFVELYQNLEITDDSFVEIEVVEKENQITSISLNLTDFEKYYQKNIINYEIEIKYSNIGMVSNLKFE